MKIGTFTLIKNESPWIAAHLDRTLPNVDQMVFFDGNSNDGTLEIIEEFIKNHPGGKKIVLAKDRDPKNLEDDYVRIFDECLHALDTDLAWFLHPDMYIVNPEKIGKLPEDLIAATMDMESFGGEPGGPLFKIEGRGEKWKNIYRLRNPDLGAHYFGHYGSKQEDVYFREITGDSHDYFGQDFKWYPYKIHDSGVKCLHFSDVRDYGRRLSRMKICLINQGCSSEEAEELAPQHARVNLKDGGGFHFVPAEYPKEILEARKRFQHLVREPINA